MPADIIENETIMETVRMNMFTSPIEKGYIFMYKIHKHVFKDMGMARKDIDYQDQDAEEQEEKNSENCVFSWSFYIKVRGKTQVIWQYHKFQDDICKEVFSNNLINGDEPANLYAGFTKRISKATVDFVLNEADSQKKEFLVEKDNLIAKMDNIKVKDLKRLNDIGMDEEIQLSLAEREVWENWWVDLLR
jgi:hypothetical protein